jgi:broad-specificity NMP kinase
MAMSVKGKDRRFYCPGHYRNIADPQACEEIIVLTHDVRLLKSHIKLRRLSNLKAPTNTRAKARDALSQAVDRLAEKAARYEREKRGPWTVTPEREREARPKLGSPKRSKSYA